MKDRILSLLRENTTYLSGEDISNLIGISRTAVWKHINSLKDEGYVIDSQTKLGYRLMRIPDRLYPAEIRPFLDTKDVGQDILYFEKVNSTNIVARKAAEEGAEHGTVVVAEEQTTGKGRLGRQWTSPFRTGVWMSMVLRPEIIPADAPKITLMAAVAVAQAISECSGLTPGIKWPNDIILNGKKVCGILAEIKADMDCIHYVVTGIGINVNNETFPEELRDIATSLRIECGSQLNRVKIVGTALTYLEKYYMDLVKGNFGKIREEWKKRSINLGQKVTVSSIKEVIEGLAVDIDENGLLVVQDADGTLHKISAGDVTLRKQ